MTYKNIYLILILGFWGFARISKEQKKTNNILNRYKTADSSFFDYKTHIAMNEKRIITAAVITADETSDGKKS